MASQSIRFPGATARLAGVLETPGGTPIAHAVFAHCFTCSKDFKAAVHISRTLAEHGIAVLRFDFTGIGESEGDFTQTDFTSNVLDLVAAANYLEAQHGPVRLLVGHSLGGTAVLAAAKRVPSARAVVTIASPAGTEHLRNTLLRKAPDLLARGQAQVDIGGRPFRVGAQLLADLQEHEVRAHVASLGRALLILHSPADAVVHVDQAAILFRAARHPKSFVSLDEADHLLLRSAEDARFVGELIATWARRYVQGP